MIHGFRHKELSLFFEMSSMAGIQPALARKIQLQLAALHSAALIDDLDLPG